MAISDPQSSLPESSPPALQIEVEDIVALIELGLRAPHSSGEERWLRSLQAKVVKFYNKQQQQQRMPQGQVDSGNET